MALNTSSKICFSKRLTITSLILIMIGFSVVVFSTLSSSVKKTTSSKASGTEGTALKDFGGKNQPCAFDKEHNPNYYCNDDTNLVCDGPLDFWLNHWSERDKIRSDDKTILIKGPKCVDPADIPMGKEGQICKPSEPGKTQCDSKLTCVQVVNIWPYITTTYLNYFNSKYKERSVTAGTDAYIDLVNILHKYAHIKVKDSASGKTEPNGICIPESLSKVESCGDADQKPCLSESGQQICFGDNRIVLLAPEARDTARCVSKITIKAKGLVRCDDGASQTCNEFCAKQGGKCVETCEDKILVDQGNEAGAKEMMVKAGMFEVQVYNLKQHPKVSGSCNQDYSPSFGPGTSLQKVCTYNHDFVPRCCCDIK